MSRLRVFAVIASSDAGGAEEVFATLLRRLDRDRFEVYVACHGQGVMFDEYRRHAAGIWSIDLLHVARPGTIVRLVRLMRETRADLVHTHLWSADLLGGLAARRAGVPTVCTVTAEYFLAIGVSPLVALRRRLLSRTYRSTYWCADRVVAVSQYLARDLAERPGIRVPAEKIDVVYNPLDEDRLAEQVRSAGASVRRWTRGSPVITTVANFHPIKGHDVLVRAMPAVVERHPGATFVLVGAGPTRAAIEARVASLGLTAHVVFTGQIPGGARAIVGSDVVAVPSLSEGFGVSVIEALALGTPVVATTAGGIPEIFGDQAVGWLVPPGDADALARAILAVLEDPAGARRRAELGRRVVAERFSVERFVGRTEHLYRTLAGGAS